MNYERGSSQLVVLLQDSKWLRKHSRQERKHRLKRVVIGAYSWYGSKIPETVIYSGNPKALQTISEQLEGRRRQVVPPKRPTIVINSGSNLDIGINSRIDEKRFWIP